MAMKPVKVLETKHVFKAEMRAKVRYLLVKYDCLSDLEERAVELILQQAELFSSESGLQ